MVPFVNKFNLNTKNGIVTLAILPANRICVQDIDRKLPKCLPRFFGFCLCIIDARHNIILVLLYYPIQFMFIRLFVFENYI